MNIGNKIRELKVFTRKMRVNMESKFKDIFSKKSNSFFGKELLFEEDSRDLGSRIKRFFKKRSVVYASFIAMVSLVCIILAHFFQGNGFREWYYNLRNEELIGKGIEYEMQRDIPQEEMTDAYGSFMTYYRFKIFGASNPAEVDVNAPMVALTFDDGPNPEYTNRILNVLNENYSHATFFVVGTNAEKYPEVLQAISASGCEIGNHTYSHADLTNIDSVQVEEEIDKVNRAVKKATGEITTVIRPPYGAYDDELLQQLAEPVVLWDMDTEDWDSRNAQVIADTVVSNVSDGDIILMHDIYDSTAEAVEIIVPRLKEMGYQVVSVSEMAAYKGKSLELGKAYGGIKQTTP